MSKRSINIQNTKKNGGYRDELKNQIVLTAARLFRTNGIRSVKMDDIVGHLSCSKRTLYELFKDKEALVLAVANYLHSLDMEKIDKFSLEAHDIMDIILESFKIQLENFRVTNPQYYYDLHKYPQVERLLVKHHNDLFNDILNVFETGVKEGFFRPDIDYNIMIDVFMGREQRVVTSKLYMKYSLTDIFKNSILVEMRGICTEKGLKSLDDFTKRNF